MFPFVSTYTCERANRERVEKFCSKCQFDQFISNPRTYPHRPRPPCHLSQFNHWSQAVCDLKELYKFRDSFHFIGFSEKVVQVHQVAIKCLTPASSLLYLMQPALKESDQSTGARSSTKLCSELVGSTRFDFTRHRCSCTPKQRRPCTTLFEMLKGELCA